VYEVNFTSHFFLFKNGYIFQNNDGILLAALIPKLQGTLYTYLQ
jgi:hypothetical protein